MKRARELEELVVEIVRESKVKDEEGKFLYPVMHEPMVLAFFGAADALLEVLRERPLIVLNLLQTNKALEAFLNRFERVWIAWTDMLIEKEMGTYVGEIYPFLVVQEHRENALACRANSEVVGADFISHAIGTRTNGMYTRWEEEDIYERPADALHYVGLHYLNGLIWRDSVDNDDFYVVYYDAMTQLFMDLLVALRSFFSSFPDPQEWRLGLEYLNVAGGSLPYFTPFNDCFLITQERGVPLALVDYNTKALRQWLASVTERTSRHEIPPEAMSLLDKLTTLVEEEAKPEKPVPLLLDKNTVTPYRILLYDREHGLLKTPHEQRAFFVNVLRRLTSEDEQAHLIEKYGCSICCKETELVDPLSMRAFCSEACHSFSRLK